jgi:nucleoside-diphosphate-sugar epimerase
LGSPGKLINLTHVSDVVDGLLKVSDDREARRDWVIRDPLSRSLADLVAIVGHVSGTPLKVVWDPARDRPREMTSEWIFGTPVTETKRTDLVEGIERLWIATVH